MPSDTLRLRLDFYHQTTEMTVWEGDTVTVKPVDALEVAHALANELSFGSGLLPPGTLWWQNTRRGPVWALYVEPHIRKVALAGHDDDATSKRRNLIKRYTIPLPGLIFICTPGEPPWVYAVKRKPTKEDDIVYRAPLCNIHPNGRSCAGSHQYPTKIGDMVESFFISFFSATADLANRSVMFPKNVIHMWEFLNGKKKYPMDDLMPHGRLSDLMRMEMER